jgi:H+-transporting ATPase
LLIAVFGTQAIATLLAVYGVFMTPLGWRYAGIVWGYALAWFLVNDRAKLLAYRIFDRQSARSKAVAKAAPKSAAIAMAQRATATIAKPETETEPAPAAKADAKPDVKTEPLPAAKASTNPDATAESSPATADGKLDANAEPAPAARVDANSAVKAELKSAAKPHTRSDLTPKLVERVHALYEELGRQDVIAVQELEKAEEGSRKELPHQ